MYRSKTDSKIKCALFEQFAVQTKMIWNWFTPLHFLVSFFFRFADKICLNLVISFFFWPWLIVWLCLVCIIYISIYMYISNVTFYFNCNIKDSSRFTVSNVTLYSRLFIYINWLFITFSVYFWKIELEIWCLYMEIQNKSREENIQLYIIISNV